MQYRCQVNSFGYCTRSPDPPSRTPEVIFRTVKGVHVYNPPETLKCIADWETCSYFVSWTHISDKYQVVGSEG